jgi:hypothetical protein
MAASRVRLALSPLQAHEEERNQRLAKPHIGLFERRIHLHISFLTTACMLSAGRTPTLRAIP